ncbi:MAG TPA: hypothetical protein VFH07_15885 [Chitinophagaceae bacterium]|nr:hypothetical protein [Chitinophagaceae bacterium]
MKTFILILHVFFLASNVSAQNLELPRSKKTDNRYWLLSLGLSIQNMYDEGISYVRYKGTGIAPSLRLIKSSEKKYCQFLLQPTFNKLKTERSNGLRPMEVKTTRFVLDYQYLVNVKEWNEKLKLYAGGNSSLLFNLKRAEQLDNSQLLYDYALSIGPAAKLDKTVRWNKRDCLASFGLSLPLLSHIARPYYLNRIEFIDPKNDFLGDLFSNSSIVSVNKHLRITSGLSFTYPLFNKNALKLGYTWDFYKMKTINSVYAAEHLISISFLSNY